jgi:hypothetical protein
MKSLDTKTLIGCVMGRKRLDEMGLKDYYAPNIAYDYYDIIKALERLKEYEELEEQGILLKPPCKVDDTIYEFHRQDLEDIVDLKDVISKREVKDVRYKNGEWFIIPYNPVNAFGYMSEREIPTVEIGKTVFFSYDGAEQELMKRQKGECGT